MSELNDIWNSGQGKLPDDKLQAYLQGKLTPEEQREVEMYLSDEGLESDAVDGLQDVDMGEVHEMTSRINYKLQRELKTKKYRNNKLFNDSKWSWLAVFMVIILCVLGYWVIKNMTH